MTSDLSSEYMDVAIEDGVAVVTLNRPDKRNALNVSFVHQLQDLFTEIPRRDDVRCVVMKANGEHFCAGLDLVEHFREERSAETFTRICQAWHDAFNKLEYSGVPVIGALKGAVVGGGLELASSFHIRVADQTTYFALPEGQRGIFTGGGATVRVARLVGKARMIDMMLTGRIYQGQEAVDVGLCQYLVPGTDASEKAMALAKIAAANPPLSNYAITVGISHIQNMSTLDGSFAEAFVAGVVNTHDGAKERLAAFSNKTAQKTKPS